MIRDLPDIELLLAKWIRVSVMPASPPNPSFLVSVDPDLTADEIARIVRVSRISGTPRNIAVDRPLVDIDVWTRTYDDSKAVSGIICTACRGIRNLVTAEGIVQQVAVLNAPRFIPDINQEFVRYGATYEFFTHAVTGG